MRLVALAREIFGSYNADFPSERTDVFFLFLYTAEECQEMRWREGAGIQQRAAGWNGTSVTAED